MDLSEVPAAAFRRHPWERARLEFFRGRARALGLDRRPLRVLDVGSGDAWLATALLATLHPESVLTCWDAGYTPAHLADLQGRYGPRVRFVTDRPGERFDLVLLLDVLEHIEDDVTFLREIVALNLVAGAHALISVPAWQALFGDHDVRLRHFRRYQPEQAAALVAGAGLTRLASGGLFHGLLLPRMLERLAARAGWMRSPPANLGEWRAGPVVSGIVETVLKWDVALSALLGQGNAALPGLSWWATCVKPSS